MRLITIFLIAAVGLSQYSLWFSSGGLLHVWDMKHQVHAMCNRNSRLEARNFALSLEICTLRKGEGILEELARTELGMIKRNEVFLQVIDANDNSN